MNVPAFAGSINKSETVSMRRGGEKFGEIKQMI